MKTLILSLIFLVSTEMLSQDTLRFTTVVDSDGYGERIHLDTGMWILSDTLLVKIEGDYQREMRVIEKKKGTYKCLNSFDEELTYTLHPSGNLVARNKTRPKEYTIYKRKKN
jgi:hypothetical protein